MLFRCSSGGCELGAGGSGYQMQLLFVAWAWYVRQRADSFGCGKEMQAHQIIPPMREASTP